MTTVSDYILEQLLAWGVTRLYGVAGDTQLHLIAQTGERIRFIPVCQESSAGIMAAAESMLTGTVGVCLATSGPGVVNMLNGLAEAAIDRTAVLALTGQVESKKIGSTAKQYLEQQVLLYPLASFTAEPGCAEAVGKVLPRALQRAVSRKELVHVSVPKDVLPQAAQQAVTLRPTGLDATYSPRQDVMEQAIAMMGSSKKPLILAGIGAHAAMDEVVSLATQWGAGLITTLGAKGAVDRDFPLNLYGLGQGGSELATAVLQECDLLLVIGSNWWPEEYAAKNLKVIQVDIDPEAVGSAPAPQIALVGRTEDIVPQLRLALRSKSLPMWGQQIRTQRDKWEAVLSAEIDQEDTLHPGLLMQALAKITGAENVITVDTGDHTVWFSRHYHGRCKKVLFSGKWRTMGFALPAAMAAAFVYPGRRVICLVGDGSLNMVLSELATLAREGLNVMVIVLKNGALTMEKNRVLNAGLNPVGLDLPEIDYVRVAEGCGVKAVRVNTVSELAGALDQGMSVEEPMLIEVNVTSPMLPHTKL